MEHPGQSTESVRQTHREPHSGHARFRAESFDRLEYFQRRLVTSGVDRPDTALFRSVVDAAELAEEAVVGALTGFTIAPAIRLDQSMKTEKLSRLPAAVGVSCDHDLVVLHDDVVRQREIVLLRQSSDPLHVKKKETRAGPDRAECDVGPP